jgi:hypothetical protein
MTITGDDGDNLLQGGYGGQVILGLDGADIIYGDPTGTPAAPFFLVDSIRDSTVFDGAFRTVSVTIGGSTYLYGTSIEDGGLTAWTVGVDGALAPLFSWNTFTYAGPVQIGGRALQVVEFDGVSYLLSSGLGLSLSSIGADGTLSHLSTIHDDALLNIDRPAAVTAFEFEGVPYAVVAGRNG